VGETFWYDQHLPVVSREFLGVPMQKGGGFRPQVNRHVPDPAAKAADHLHLRMRRVLKVHTTHGPGVPGYGLVDLHNLAVTQYGSKFLGAEEAHERAAVVAVGQRLHDFQISQRGVEYLHAVARLRSEATALTTRLLLKPLLAATGPTSRQ
jgi:hypothetical protein